MTCPARTTLALLVAVLALSAGCEERTTLVDVREHYEAGRILLALDSAAVEGARVRPVGEGRDRRFEVTVPAEAFDAAQRVMYVNGYPRPEVPTTGELFAEGGMMEKELQQRVKLAVGQGNDLARMIEAHDRVREAFVQIATDPVQRIATARDEPPPLTATVVYYYFPAGDGGVEGGGGAPFEDDQLRQDVASAVANISPEAVRVSSLAVEAYDPPVSVAVRPAAAVSPTLVWLLAAAAGVFGLSTAGLLLTMAFRKDKPTTRVSPAYEELPSYPPGAQNVDLSEGDAKPST